MIPAGAVKECSEATATWLGNYMEKHKAAIDTEVLKLTTKMKANSLMKPLGFDCSDAPLAQNDETNALGKPWLMIGRSFTMAWGLMKWPIIGLPAVMTCVGGKMVVGVVSMVAMMQNQVTWDTPDWVTEQGGESKLTRGQVLTRILCPGDMLMVPFAHAVLWAPIDKAALEKRKKGEAAPVGKALVAWRFPAEPTIAKKEYDEVQHKLNMLWAKVDGGKPWADFKAQIDGWIKVAGEKAA